MSYLVNESGPVSFVIHHPNDLDGPLNETTTDKIRQYHSDYNNRPSDDISFMSVIDNDVYIVNLCVFYSYRLIGKLPVFFSSSGSVIQRKHH